jgi:hypothetical protein
MRCGVAVSLIAQTGQSEAFAIDGMVISRFYLPPKRKEKTEKVLADFRSGNIKNVAVLKMRLAMSLRILREIRRRTRVVGSFPDGQSALNLAAARLRYIAGTAWSTKRYLNIELLKDQQMRGAITA